ncbi:hypothetical protein [Thermoflavimicrobium daqui]|uniref:Uncharacterized protein n=1 Tax=Thermoflavimicrobium daqui TaxID=2137476 RepID=A0A364K299_9BACL|nr:hypothetical protein [Thermoflavimicrobium daqui]RAL22536.1 hypothetical protein DL897_14080 [Thermoflavimicrobium daqui]
MKNKQPHELLEYFRTEDGQPIETTSTHGSPIDYKKIATKVGATIMVSALSAGALAGCINGVDSAKGIKHFNEMATAKVQEADQTSEESSKKQVEINISDDQFQKIIDSAVKVIEQKQSQKSEEFVAQKTEPQVEEKTVDDLINSSPLALNHGKKSLLDLIISVPDDNPEPSKSDTPSITASTQPIQTVNKNNKQQDDNLKTAGISSIKNLGNPFIDDDYYDDDYYDDYYDDDSDTKKPNNKGKGKGHDKKWQPKNDDELKIVIAVVPVFDDYGNYIGTQTYYSDGTSVIDYTDKNHNKDDNNKNNKDDNNKNNKDDNNKNNKDDNNKNNKDDNNKNNKDDNNKHDKDDNNKHDKDGNNKHDKDSNNKHDKDDNNKHDKDDNNKHDKDDNNKHDKDGNNKHDKDSNNKHDKDGNNKHDKDGNNKHDKDGNNKHDKDGNNKHDKDGNNKHDKDGNNKHDKDGNNKHDKDGNNKHDKDGNNKQNDDGLIILKKDNHDKPNVALLKDKPKTSSPKEQPVVKSIKTLDNKSNHTNDNKVVLPKQDQPTKDVVKNFTPTNKTQNNNITSKKSYTKKAQVKQYKLTKKQSAFTKGEYNKKVSLKKSKTYLTKKNGKKSKITEVKLQKNNLGQKKLNAL